MNKYHVQCKMKNDRTNYTAWIPQENARKGNVVNIDGVGEFIVQELGTIMETDRVNRQSARVRRGIFDSIK